MPFTNDSQCYSGNPLDRAQVERRDPAQLDKLLAAPESRFAPFQGDRPLIALSDSSPAGDIGWLPLNDSRVQHIDHCTFHLLGKTADGHARFVCDIHRDGEDFDREAAQFGDVGKFIDLRSVGLQGLIPNGSLGILAHGKQ